MRLAFLLTFLFGLHCFAIEAVVPKTLCDRFLNSNDQKMCEQRIEKMNPDSYLSALCAHQFDDDQFYKCMELSQKSHIDPRKLAKCEDSSLNDQERITCIQNQFETKKPSSRRLPASQHKKSKN